MKGTMIIITPQGERITKPRESTPTLEWLKDGIGGGYIELVPGFTTIIHQGKIARAVVFCDDEGKNKNMPINIEATKLWDEALRRSGRPGLFQHGRPVDVLVGQIAIVVGDNEFLELL